MSGSQSIADTLTKANYKRWKVQNWDAIFSILEPFPVTPHVTVCVPLNWKLEVTFYWPMLNQYTVKYYITLNRDVVCLHVG